jgi:thiol-disulfide isomerase/thioredoxin
MKRILQLLILILFTHSISAQTNVHINGQLVNHKPNYQYYIGTGEVLIPIDVNIDGSFEIDVNYNALPNVFSLNGLTSKYKLQKFTSTFWLINDSINANIDVERGAVELNHTAEYQNFSEQLEKLSKRKRKKKVLANINALPSLYFLDNDKERYSRNELANVLSKINPDMKELVYVKRIENYLEAKSKPKVKVGRQLDSFSLPDKNNRLTDVIVNNGKPTLLVFVSTGCGYSMASISFLETFYKKNGNSVNLITIWDDATKNTWLNYKVEVKSKIIWTDLWDEFGFASTYFGNNTWPTFYIVNKNGVLQNEFKGINEKTIEKIKVAFEQ